MGPQPRISVEVDRPDHDEGSGQRESGPELDPAPLRGLQQKYLSETVDRGDYRDPRQKGIAHPYRRARNRDNVRPMRQVPDPCARAELRCLLAIQQIVTQYD